MNNEEAIKRIDEIILKEIDNENLERFGYEYYALKGLRRVKNVLKETNTDRVYICSGIISAVFEKCQNCDCQEIRQ